MSAFPPGHYQKQAAALNSVSKQSILTASMPPGIPRFSREAIFSMSMSYGQTGSGKTIGLCFRCLEKYHIKVPQFGVSGFKIFWIDLQKAEFACVFQKMTPDHPLYQILISIGFQPESYPVEVLRPLVYIRGEPALLYAQPDIVKPFSISLSDLSLIDWIALFPGGLSVGQMNLHHQALKELNNRIRTISMHDLYVKVQEIIERGKAGYGSHIKGMETAPTITMTKKVFGAREAQGLLQKYQALMDTSLIMPSSVKTNINVRKMLEDQKKITVLYVPQFKDLPHLHMGIINFFLTQISHAKSLNNPERVQVPINIGIPELRNLCPKHIPQEERYYIEPVRNTLLDLVSQGAGMGLCIDADTQFFEQIPDEYRTNVTTTFIYDMGEEASEKIREVVRGRYVSNFKEITDDWHLSSLKEPGTFVYLGYQKLRAEIRKNALPGFWYPRARAGEKETETNFYDLFKRFHPDRIVDIFPLYAQNLKINLEAQTRAAENMTTILTEKAEEQKVVRQQKETKLKKTQEKILRALLEIGEGTKEPFMPYSRLTKELSEKIKRGETQTQRIIKDLAKTGLLFIDSREGAKKQKVVLNLDKIRDNLGDDLERRVS
jgi:hypothetical protein